MKLPCHGLVQVEKNRLVGHEVVGRQGEDRQGDDRRV